MLARPFQPNHLYVQIRNELARRIAKEEYVAGAPLPNEFALAQEMGVSIGTIRKAVELLCEEKLVVRSQGHGTIVTDRKSVEYRSKFDRIRNADGMPISWHLREIKRTVRPADETERNMLRIGAGASVISFRRLRELAGSPIKSEYSRLPHGIFGDVDDLEVQDTTIENISVRRGVTISSMDERLTLVDADDAVSLELKIPAGLKILRMERVVYDTAQRPIEWRICFCNLGDRQYQVPSTIGARSK